MTCPACQSDHVTVEATPNGPHYAKDLCADCGRFLRWLPKPDSDKARRPAAHRELVRKYGRGFCELCGTPENALPTGQVLEGHHIVAYADGGSDDRDNVLILCTACHKLTHWLRTWARPKGTGTA